MKKKAWDNLLAELGRCRFSRYAESWYTITINGYEIKPLPIIQYELVSKLELKLMLLRKGIIFVDPMVGWNYLPKGYSRTALSQPGYAYWDKYRGGIFRDIYPADFHYNEHDMQYYKLSDLLPEALHHETL